MKIRIAACQLKVAGSKEKNLANAKKWITRAAKNADIIVLPEMFNCPYDLDYFPKFAERYPGKTTLMLSHMAKDLNKYIIGGTIPEKEQQTIYNTCFAFNSRGKLAARHRKIHLFDVDIKGGITFKESEVLSPGKQITLLDTEYGKLGLCICYDMRFPELIRNMALKGAQAVIVPAAFNMTTGPAHWHIVTRTRALDNQVYLVAVSPARTPDASYTAYGHSLIADPWGKIVAQAGTRQEIAYATLDLSYIEKIRQQLPLLKHLRKDLYFN